MMKQHYAGMDGLRGCAALAVMFMHQLGYFRPGLGPAIHAQVAVDLFFMLSGFVLAFAYDKRLAIGMTWSEFMIIRFIRLYPMLFLSISLSACLAIVKVVMHRGLPVDESLWLLPAGYLLLPASLFIGNIAPFAMQFDPVPFGGPAWSLLFEILASAAFAMSFRRTKRHALAIFLAGSIVLCALSFAAGGTGALGLHGYIGFPAGVFRVGVTFSIGIFLFRHNLMRRAPILPNYAVLIAGLTLCSMPFSRAPFYDLLCTFVLFPALILVSAKSTYSRLSHTISIQLGALSYPLYLLHYPVSRLIGFVAKSMIPSVGANILIALSMIGSIACSFLALRLFDEPVRGWLTARFRGNRAASLP